MTQHSSIVGGSTADRLLRCPGSYQATLALPKSADVPSEYAEEGTAMHAVMAVLMAQRASDEVSDPVRVGQHFHDRELTQAHIDEMIQPALDALNELERIYGGGFKVLAIEKSVKFPRIPGAFGTIDLILANNVTVLHVDWKFGSGVPVPVLYRDDQGERVNPQLMYYCAAAMNSARHLYRGKTNLVLAIIQPRVDPPLSHVAISRKEIKWFIEDLEGAVIAALGRNPVRNKGEHCRWAPCKVSCPLWVGPFLDLATLHLTPRTDVVSNKQTAYGDYLARAKALVDIVAQYKREVDEQLWAYLEDGGYVPGWRLKPRPRSASGSTRMSSGMSCAGARLRGRRNLGRQVADLAAIDATAKRLGVKIPDHLRVAPPSTETTIATTDDPAPVVEKPLAIEQFAAALQQLMRNDDACMDKTYPSQG